MKWRTWLGILILWMVQLCWLVPVSGELVVTFERLGDLPGGWFSSVVTDISVDASVVVGAGGGLSGNEGFVWRNGTMTSLGPFTVAKAVSSDGLTVVGLARDSDADEWGYPMVWNNGNATRLTGIDGAEVFGWAALVSGDGSVVVGVDAINEQWLRWENGNVDMIGKSHDPETEYYRFHSLSADGTVLVGARINASGIPAPGYWKDGLWTTMGYPDAVPLGTAYGVSADGSAMAGTCAAGGQSQACRWINGVIHMLAHPAGATGSSAYYMSDDGKVILGKAYYDDAPWEDVVLWKVATQWNPNPMQTLLSTYPVGVDAGLLSIDLPGESGGLSGDGATFGGQVTDTGEAFLLNIVNMWGQYVIQNRYVDTTPWIGWLYIREAPWVWSVDLSNWLYVPIESAQAGQGWVYVAR